VIRRKDITVVPYGVNRLHNIFARRDQVSAGLPDGRYVTAVCEPYDSFPSRVRAAWWVVTGRAHALVWPEAGELELALYPDTKLRPGGDTK